MVFIRDAADEEKARQQYLQREKWRLDKISSEKYFLKKGRIEGKAEGIEQGIKEGRIEERRKMVEQLLRKGMDKKFIMDISGFSEEEIECIRGEIE